MRLNEPELLDIDLNDVREVEESLHDMETLLRALGLGRRTLRHFRKTGTSGAKLRILDVGTGSGWLARLLRDACRKSGREAEVVALDISEVILNCARRIDSDGIRFVAGDATSLNFPSGTFDFVACSTMLHHLSTPDAEKALREIDRVAAGTWVSCDLRRRPGAYLGARIVCSLFSSNRMTRHDGPLSFKRAFSLQEFRALTAGMPHVICETWGPLCFALVGRPERL
jgi:2-polyprenyl-3-methyl-5-hydroxy-6-metoxy-1,4-benzoquinol methylase